MHVWVMPWVGLRRRKIDFGQVSVWNFYEHVARKTDNAREIAALTKLMECFRGLDDKPVKDLGILQIGPVAFEQNRETGNNIARWATQAIRFAYLSGLIENRLASEPDRSHAGNGEQFNSLCFNLSRSGQLYYPELASNCLTDTRISPPIFRQPFQLKQKFHLPDTLLLDGLARFNAEHQGSNLWRRLQICFEWFALAWSSSPDVSHQVTFVALMTSYEALQRTSTKQRAPQMGLATARKCGWDTLPETETYRDNSRTYPTNKAHKFIIDFGSWRNEMVHGNPVGYGWIRHVVGDSRFEPKLVMSQVIRSLVIRLLLEKNAWPEEFERSLAEAHANEFLPVVKWDTEDSIGESPHVGAVLPV